MTTINPVQTPVAQGPAFRGKTTKRQQKIVDSTNKVMKELELKQLMKTDPERVKTLIINDSIKNLTNFLKKFKVKL